MRKWRRPRTVAGMMQGVKMTASPELNTEVDNRVVGTHPSFLLLSHHAQGFLFFFFKYFSYLFLARLDLHCCMSFSLVAVSRLLNLEASLVEHRP